MSTQENNRCLNDAGAKGCLSQEEDAATGTRPVVRNQRSWHAAPAVALALGATVVTAEPAGADMSPWDYYPGCRDYIADMDGVASLYYYETTTHTIPSSSGCADVNSIAHPSCDAHRVRFYPSSGDPYVSSWVNDCDGPTVIVTNVLNGTKYRNEAFGNIDTHFHIED